MDDLARQIEEARQHIEPQWDAAKVETSLGRFHGRLRRRRATRTAVVAAAPLLIITVALSWGWLENLFAPRGPHMIASTTLPPMSGRQISGPGTSIHFADGSSATTMSLDSHLVAAEVSSSNIRVRLEGGSARFEVSPRPERLFQVDAGDLSVLVLGTVFSVNRTDESITVEVERGRVRVAGPDGAHVVEAGHSEVFERPTTEEIEEEAPAEQRPDQQDSNSRRPSERVSESWRALAEQGSYDEAYQALMRSGGLASIGSMSEALIASDVARLSGHPQQAVDLLQRSISRHPGDPQTSVAQYTLGRVLLNQVGRHRAAAEAFARARRLAPGGALAEDALAREVEAWSRAGVDNMARLRASEYVERYPQGRRLNAVRRLGGLN